MFYSHRGVHRIKKRSIRRLILYTAILLISAALILDAYARPAIRTIAGNGAVNAATALISNTVTEEIKTLGISYDDLVVVEYNGSGQVTAVRADSLKMNWLKSEVTGRVATAVNNIGEIPISIPVGTLTGFSVFSGRGPVIKLYTSLSGSISVNIKNVFETAGINQTLHRIVLEINANVSLLGLGGNVCSTFITNVPVAETIIVGLIPQIYAGPNDNLWPDLVN